MYRFMDKEELLINQITNLKMVHIYDLADTNHVTALAVYYDDNKQMNLSVMDKHYKLLLDKVIELYSREEDKELIMADQDTRKLLELACDGIKRETASVNRAGNRYMDMEAKELPKYSPNGKIRYAMLPMVKYFLKELYGLWNMDISFREEDLSGWNGKGVIKGLAGSEEVVLPYSVSFGNNTYIIDVGNFLEQCNNITFDISYKSDSLIVSFESQDYALWGEARFGLMDREPVSVTTIRANGQVVYYNTEPVEKANEQLLKDRILNTIICGESDINSENQPQTHIILDKIIDSKLLNGRIVRLPWDSYYLCNINVVDDGAFKRTDYDGAYLDINYRTIFLRHSGWSVVENIPKKLTINVGGARMDRLIPDTKEGFIQTYFYPVGYSSGWDYKIKLENKYFYEYLKQYE